MNRKAVYHGRMAGLLGKTAIVRPVRPIDIEPGVIIISASHMNSIYWLVQFDDFSLPKYLTHNWVIFDRDDFTLYPETNFDV